MKTTEERADKYIDKNFTRIADGMPICEGMRTIYIESATEQKKIDEVRMRKLEEALKAYRAFCYNIINGTYIDNEKAAVEQLEYINTDFFNEEGFELLEDTK